MRNLFEKWKTLNIVTQIIVGLIVGVVLGIAFPEQLSFISLLGDFFVAALKAVAPILVFFLVMGAIARGKKGTKTNMKSVIGLYIAGTFLAASAGVIASLLFPLTLTLEIGQDIIGAPGGTWEVIENLIFSAVSNPVDALMNANYIGILTWAVLLGIALRKASDTTKTIFNDIANGVSEIVKWVVKLAPLGIMGLVFSTIASQGLAGLSTYLDIITLLVGIMIFVGLVINPFLAFVKMRRNPYPLIFQCLKESGITAFFTRSSAANIPVNLALCEKLGLDEETYYISIPLGATINMCGSAVTIATLTLAAVNTLGIEVSFTTMIVFAFLSALSACGVSGVAYGALLLIPMACSLFGIPDDIIMQVVGVGFIVSIVQDSCETALNSSTDVVFTAACDEKFRYKK